MTRRRVHEGDFRGFNGRTPCAPTAPTSSCANCARHQPALANVLNRSAVVIDASTVLKAGERCRMFA